MTANHEHTPTTGQVETGFALYLYDRENIVIGAGRDRFKAWLAARDARITAAAEQRGEVKALREAASSGLFVGPIADLLENRADRIANKEGER